jgi:DNA polymerase II small subunit/DNA polymerase delta subunit B
MNEEEVVRLFLENGFQISKNALGLASRDPEKIIFHLKKMKNRPFIITEQHIKEVLKGFSTREAEVKILKEYTFAKKSMSVDDYVEELSSRYEKIKSLLLKQMAPKQLVSINKIGPQTTNFSIIGLVREKNNDSILVEDPTGEVCVFFDDTLKEKLNEIFLDDVIGVTIKKIKEKFYARTITFPDISSNREISKTENDVVLAVVSGLSNLDEIKYKNLTSALSSIENLSHVVFFDDVVNEKITHDFSRFNPIFPKSNPTLFQIDKIKILVLPKLFFETLTFDFNMTDPITLILKKRHLFPTFFPKIHCDDILEEIPDIIISNLNETMNKNYKGTTILSNSNPSKTFLINLRTREVIEKTI